MDGGIKLLMKKIKMIKEMNYETNKYKSWVLNLYQAKEKEYEECDRPIKCCAVTGQQKYYQIGERYKHLINLKQS